MTKIKILDTLYYSDGIVFMMTWLTDYVVFSRDKQHIKLEKKWISSFKSCNSKSSLHIGYKWGEEGTAKQGRTPLAYI